MVLKMVKKNNTKEIACEVFGYLISCPHDGYTNLIKARERMKMLPYNTSYLSLELENKYERYVIDNNLDTEIYRIMYNIHSNVKNALNIIDAYISKRLNKTTKQDN